MRNKISPKLISLSFGILVLTFTLVFYIFAWTEPIAIPPGDNTPSPLDASNIGQSKEGGLILNTAGAEAGLIVLGEITNPVGGLCPSGYDWYDYNDNSVIDNGECQRTLLFASSTGNVGIGTQVPTDELVVQGDIQTTETIYFSNEYDNGDSGIADTIDWGSGNKQKSTLTNNVTFTFIAPAGPSNLMLRLVQDAVGGYTITFPGTIRWVGGIIPTLTTVANAEDIISCYYNGSSYYCMASLDFK